MASDEWVAPVVPLFGSRREGAAGEARTGLNRPSEQRPTTERGAERTDRPATSEWAESPPAGAPIDEPSATERAESTEARFAKRAERRAEYRNDAPEGSPREKAAERAERRARNVSVAALARRGMSVAELRDRLVDRGIEPDEVEAEVDRLQDARYLDDAALAESVVRAETERKGRGRSAVAAELRRRRVDTETIEAALESLDDEGERERAVAVAEQRARQLSGYDTETARRRLYGFLQRRGFSGSVLQHAVDAALASRS